MLSLLKIQLIVPSLKTTIEMRRLDFGMVSFRNYIQLARMIF